MSDINPYTPPESKILPSSPNGSIELASRWKRLGGALIDGLIGFAVAFPVMYLTGFWQRAMERARTDAQPDFSEIIIYGAYGLIAFIVIHGYFLHTYGQTVGKRLIGTRIVSVQDQKILPLWKVFTLRYLPISIIAQIPMAGQWFSVIDSLFVFRKDKRCIHDLIAGTMVIDAVDE